MCAQNVRRLCDLQLSRGAFHVSTRRRLQRMLGCPLRLFFICVRFDSANRFVCPKFREFIDGQRRTVCYSAHDVSVSVDRDAAPLGSARVRKSRVRRQTCS